MNDFYIFVSAGYFGNSFISYLYIFVLKINDGVYTVDCIWFNALMSLIYLILFFITDGNEKLIQHFLEHC